jgi:hypothetical protein
MTSGQSWDVDENKLNCGFCNAVNRGYNWFQKANQVGWFSHSHPNSRMARGRKTELARGKESIRKSADGNGEAASSVALDTALACVR